MNDVLIEISAAAIITAIFKILVPGETHKEQIKLIISCFFIITAINIVTDNIDVSEIKDIFITEISYNDYSVDFEHQTAEKTADNLRGKLLAEMEKEQIKPDKIYIDINISDKTSISISKIRLVFPDINTSEAERAVEIAEKCTGNEISIELEEQ